ncbi:MAG: helix-turn-helix domain-containing protein [Bacteroidaceae bacterium]|nr:helix-turn-helix domain-containing protein [Bacteroidaceae bacterium]
MAIIRKTILVIAACAIAIVCVNVKNYRATRAEIRNEINMSFRQLAPNWPDSIMRITDEPRLYTYDTEHYKKRNVKRFVWAEGDVSVSPNLFHPEHLDDCMVITDATALMTTEDYDLQIVDSLWNGVLHRAGHRVTATVTLDAKDLREMFPTPDTLVTEDITVKHYESRPHPTASYWATDSVSIGICNHGILVGRVDIPMDHIASAMPWWTYEHTLLVTLMVLATLYFLWQNLVWKFKRTNKLWMGCSMLDAETGVMISLESGKTTKLSKFNLEFLSKISETPQRELSKQAICDMFWPKRELKGCTSNYNTFISRLRSELAPIDHTIEIRTLPDGGIGVIYLRPVTRSLFLLRHLMKEGI